MTDAQMKQLFMMVVAGVLSSILSDRALSYLRDRDARRRTAA